MNGGKSGKAQANKTDARAATRRRCANTAKNSNPNGRCFWHAFAPYLDSSGYQDALSAYSAVRTGIKAAKAAAGRQAACAGPLLMGVPHALARQAAQANACAYFTVLNAPLHCCLELSRALFTSKRKHRADRLLSLTIALDAHRIRSI
jgi:hypothetical protein